MSNTAQCTHDDLHVHVNLAHIGDTNVKYVEIKAHCKTCGAPMVFRGMPGGMSPHRPCVDIAGYEARLPIIAEGEDVTGDPVGFSVTPHHTNTEESH